ncbi:MAG: hypothetical protein P8177_12220 [Gemmatimonadota bacterium]|jgi:hypothetical protein
MKRLAQAASGAALAFTVVPSFLVFAGAIPWRTHAVWMLVGTLLWFATAPFWMVEAADEPRE